MLKRVLTIAGIMTLAGSSLLADFTYQETSTITGGMMMSMMKIAGVFSKQAREPIQSTIAVKGDRMVHRTSTHASVIDLGSGTITSIDFQKKQYSVMTFDEMKQMMEQMSQKMQKNDKGEMKFKVSANATGKTKQVSGFEAKEMIMKMEMEGTDKESGQKGGMTVTTDMWIAPGIPGYQEVRDFYKRMAEKINWTPGGNMFAANPQVSRRNGRSLQGSRQAGRRARAAAHLDGRGRAAWRGGRAGGRQRGARATATVGAAAFDRRRAGRGFGRQVRAGQEEARGTAGGSGQCARVGRTGVGSARIAAGDDHGNEQLLGECGGRFAV